MGDADNKIYENQEQHWRYGVKHAMQNKIYF